MKVLSIEMIILEVSTAEGVGEGVGVGIGVGVTAGALATLPPQPAISKPKATAKSVVVLDVVKVCLPERSVSCTGDFVAQRASKLVV